MPNPFLPYGRQCIDDADVEAVANVLRGDWLTGGPVTAQFEQAFALRVGARFAVACANGTAGLHLAALALDLGPMRGAVVPTLTFLATANGPAYVQAPVTFADVDAATGLMTPATLAQALDRAGPDVAAVFPVHLNGQIADLETIHAMATARALAVVEDAAHAVGATYTTRSGEVVSVGSCRHSAMTVFSLHPVKTIAMGEGGVVTTNDPVLYERLTRLRNHGMNRDPSRFVQPDEGLSDGQPNPWYYEMAEPGFNYRASEIHCALGLSQLGKLDRFLQRREQLAALYDDALAPLAPRLRPVPHLAGMRSGWHLYVVHMDFAAIGIGRADVMRRLAAAGIGSQVHYLPVHRQPYWRAIHPDLTLDGADAYYAGCLSLPLFPAMANDDVVRVAQALTAIVEGGS